jgi:hypothetical protein
MAFRKGEVVTARRQLAGIDVPVVPAGCSGTVVKTTVFGRPKTVHFEVADGWGVKRFDVDVQRGDVDRSSPPPL